MNSQDYYKRPVFVLGDLNLIKAHNVIDLLMAHGIPTKIMARNKKLVLGYSHKNLSIIEANPSQLETLNGHFAGVETVICALNCLNKKSAIFDKCLDYQNNVNIIQEAEAAGVKKIIYIVSSGNKPIRDSLLKQVQNNFVEVLNGSGVSYNIITDENVFCSFDVFLNSLKKRKVFTRRKNKIKANSTIQKSILKIYHDNIATKIV